MKNNIGVLLTNIGTPDKPTAGAVRRYLREFLSDRRVVEIPKFIWLPILYGLILPFRAKKSANLYQKIWTEQGSPLLHYSQKLTLALQQKLAIPIELGMHYGNPSIQAALDNLRSKGSNKILILPLYPQYSATTTASSFDLVAAKLKHYRKIPEIRMVTDYAEHPAYIEAICQSIQTEQEKWGKPDRLIFSFHGIPKLFIEKGDPYQSRCQQTVALIAAKLGLNDSEYLLTFQSRLGRAEWLQPYTDQTLMNIPQQNIKHIQLICPGFAVDCLETLEEIAIQGKKQFLSSGGSQFNYIPALNDSKNHVEMLAEIIQNQTMKW